MDSGFVINFLLDLNIQVSLWLNHGERQAADGLHPGHLSGGAAGGVVPELVKEGKALKSWDPCLECADRGMGRIPCRGCADRGVKSRQRVLVHPL